MFVSIHAPVWGATQRDRLERGVIAVSIHAPVWGATEYYDAACKRIGFNPRARVGRDHSAENQPDQT